MKRIVVLLFCLPFLVQAQNKTLLIEGAAPDLYLNHTVAAKENIYSIGRMYNISPSKELAPYNHLELEKGLSLNQVVKVPLTAGNFVQGSAAAADEALVPVYHIVKEKEGLYHIATSYNKIPLQTLKQWNNLKIDAVSNGTKLVVGYLKVKKELSPLSGMAKPVPVSAPAVAVKETPKPEVTTEKLPPAKNTETKAVEEKAPVEKKVDKPVAVAQAPVKNEPAPVAKETAAVTRTGKNFNGGFFKPDFDKQTRAADARNEAGTAAVFKSTSGWEDGKYYCLHNTAAAGTIVKVTNTATGKTVYAKVLDVIPDIKQNSGLLIRISNAAAGELGAGENKFDCTVSFLK